MRLTTVVAMIRELAMATVLPFVLLCCPSASAQTAGWSEPVNLKVNDTRETEFVAMAASPGGKVFALWQSNNQPPYALRAQIFLRIKDGRSWSAPIAITDTGSMDRTPDVALDRSGNPHVVFGEYASSEIFYTYFDGTRWSPRLNVSETPSGESYFPRIAVDDSNTVHVVWHDNVLGSYQVLYRSFSRATGWSQISVVSDSARHGDFPRIAIDHEGTVHITYTRRMPPEGMFDVYYRSCIRGLWSPIDRITFDDSLASNYPCLAIGERGTPVIVWTQQHLPRLDFNNGVYYSTHDGSGWTGPYVLKDTTESADPCLVIDNHNTAHIVWTLVDRVVTHVGSILYSSGTLDGGEWTPPVSLSLPASVGAYRPVVALDSSGTVHVLWRSFDQGVYYTCRSTLDGVGPRSDGGPLGFALEQNYPNPFNPSTTIRYGLRNRTHVLLSIFNTLGQQVAILQNGEQDTGYHEVKFDAQNLPSGVYFYRIQAGNYTETKRLLLLR